jgi:hypothetical protein
MTTAVLRAPETGGTGDDAIGLQPPAQLSNGGCCMKENEKPQAFSRCGHRAQNCSVLKLPLQPRCLQDWSKFSWVWSRKCCSRARNSTRVAELKHHAERVRDLTINRRASLDRKQQPPPQPGRTYDGGEQGMERGQPVTKADVARNGLWRK